MHNSYRIVQIVFKKLMQVVETMIRQNWKRCKWYGNHDQAS
jgi:uncharacterized protein YaaR (DUF327 family)